MDEFFPQIQSSWQPSCHPKALRANSRTSPSPSSYDTSNYAHTAPRVVHMSPHPTFSVRSSQPKSSPIQGNASYEPSNLGGNLQPGNPNSRQGPIQRRGHYSHKSEGSDVKERGRLAHVEAQKSKAFRENPNIFRKEQMLYINAIVNGVQMPLFIDTGAQASVMSLETCRNLGLIDEIDETQSGIASGVGFARIYGKLWRVPVQIGRNKFFVQFNILNMGVRLILGLDQMKRLGMSVDLGRGGCIVRHTFVPFVKPPNEEYLESGQGLACAIM